MNREVVMYSRTMGCPFVIIAKRVLHEHGIPYREIFIDEDHHALERVINWTGFRSVPTLVAAYSGQIFPYIEPTPLEKGKSPRGVNRGSMITEATADELIAWLRQNNLMPGE